MSILRNLLRAAQQAGPGAVDALKQQLRSAGSAPQRQLLDAARSVGITLQQSGNPAGKAILDVVAPGTAGSVRRAAVRPVQRTLQTQAANRLAARRAELGPPAPRPDAGWAQAGRRPAATPAPAPASARTQATPRTAPPLPERFIPEGSTVYQPNLPNPQGPGGRFQSIYGEPRAVIQGRQRMAVPVDTGATRGPAVSPGQLAIDSLGYDVPTGPLGENLLRQDPGTYQSIADLARRASETYNRTITPEDLLGAQNLPARLLNPGARGGALANITAPIGARRQIPGSTEMPGVRIGNSSQPWGEIPVRTARVVDLGSTPRMAAGADIPSTAVSRGAVQAAVQNAVGGTRATDLRKLAAMMGLTTAGAAGLGAIGYNMFGGGGRTGAGYPPLDPRFDPAKFESGAYDPSSGSEQYTPPTAEDYYGSATGGVPGQTAPAVIRTNDGASVQRQAAANAVASSMLRPDAPSAYSNVGGYYQARNTYAAQPGVVGNLIEQLVQVDPRFDRPELQAWAAANPGLAYEMLNNQQMPTMQQPEITTELGSNTPNNAIGNSEEQAKVILEGADPALRDATRPRMAVSLQNPFYARPGFAAAGRF